MKRKFIPILTLSALLSLGAMSGTLVSCGEINNKDDDNGQTKTLTLEASKTTIEVGSDITFTIKLDDSNLMSGYEFTSSNPSVLAIKGTKATAISAGEAKVYATYKGAKSNEVTITVTEKGESYTSLTDAILEASEGEANASKGVTSNEYSVKAVVVSTDKDANMVIYDGESYGYIYKSSIDISGYNVGDTLKVKGALTNYYGCLQFSDPAITKLNESIALPTPSEYDAKKFEEYGANAAKNSSKITTGIATRNEYVTVSKLKYVGGSKFELMDATTSTYKLISVYKTEKTYRENNIENLANGTEVSITGSILGFNSGKGYFNLIANEVKVTKEAIKATGITLDVGSGTVETYGSLKLSATLSPEGAGGNVSYSLAKGDEAKAKIVDDKLYGLEEGEVTVTAKVDSLVSEAKKVTITKGNNAFANAEVKTVSEMAELTSADQTKVYKVTGVVSEAKSTDIYGNIIIKDTNAEKAIKAYGTSSDFTAFSEADGKLKFNNPKNFNTAILNKLFAQGDTVEFFVVPYTYNKSLSYYFAFNKLVKKGEGGETPVTPTTTTTIDGKYKVVDPEIGKTYKLGLDQKALNKTLYLNGNIARTNYFDSIDNPTESVDVSLEGSLETCKAYFTKDGVKTYIEADSYINTSGKTSYKASLVTTPTLTWKYDSTLKTLITTIDNVDVYIGTYNDFSTFNVSKKSYATNDSNYVSHFLTKLEESEKVHVTGVTADASITVDEKKTAKINASVTPDNATVKGLTYTSNNTEIATVNDEGVISGVKAGETTITVASKEDPTKTATVKVTVKKVETPAGLVEKTYNFTNLTGKASSDGKVVTFFEGDEVINFEQSIGTNVSYKPNSTIEQSLRMYKGHNLIVTAKDNVDLQSISFTYDDYSSKKYVVDLVAKSGETTFVSTFDKDALSYVVEGLSGYKTITFSNNDQARFVSMTVSYLNK